MGFRLYRSFCKLLFSTNIVFLRPHIAMYLGLGNFSYRCADFHRTNHRNLVFNIPFWVFVRNSAAMIFSVQAEGFSRLYLQLEFLDHGLEHAFSTMRCIPAPTQRFSWSHFPFYYFGPIESHCSRTGVGKCFLKGPESKYFKLY